MAMRAGLSELGELLHAFDEVIAKVPEARERALKAAEKETASAGEEDAADATDAAKENEEE